MVSNGASTWLKKVPKVGGLIPQIYEPQILVFKELFEVHV